MTADALYLACADVLAASVAALEAEGITAPERRYVSLGPPQAGICCEQITVHLDHLFPTVDGVIDISGRKLLTCAYETVALLVVTVTRCTHGPPSTTQDPDIEDLAGDAREAYRDGWVIWRALATQAVGEDCGGGVVGPLAPFGPSGNCGGVTVRTYRGVSD